MKVTRTEKIWLAAVVIIYICYNLPFVPGYNNAVGTVVHAMVTLIPLWAAIYIGFFKVCKIYKVKARPEDQAATTKKTSKKIPSRDKEVAPC